MKILLPMEFSDVSLNVFDYADKRFPVASYTILHVISNMANVNFPYHVQSGTIHGHNMIERIEEMIVKHLGVTDLPQHINVEVYNGEPVSVIKNYLKKHTYDAVFIGSRDKYNLLDKIFGTTSLGIIKSVKEPIFVVPKYAKYKGYKKILVACDEHLNDPDVMMALNYWNSSNASIKFLHINDDTKNNNFDKAKEKLLVNLYEDYQPSFSYEIEEIKSNDVAQSLLTSAYSCGADLLVSIAKNATFLHSLIFKNLTKDLILKSTIPLLFIHHSKP